MQTSIDTPTCEVDPIEEPKEIIKLMKSYEKEKIKNPFRTSSLKIKPKRYVRTIKEWIQKSREETNSKLETKVPELAPSYPSFKMHFSRKKRKSERYQKWLDKWPWKQNISKFPPLNINS